MKAKIAATVMAITVIIAVFLNTFLLLYNIDEIIRRVDAATTDIDGADVYVEIYNDFKKREKFISLPVSHDDLTDIRNDFAEILGAAEAEDEESLIIAKSRLGESLLHLRRLCGISFDSIF